MSGLPYSDMSVTYQMLYMMTQKLHSGLVHVVPIYSWPHDRVSFSADEVTFCDCRGITCFSSGLNRFLSQRAVLYHLRAILCTHTVIMGPFLPVLELVGDALPYDLTTGHFVSTVWMGLFVD